MTEQTVEEIVMVHWPGKSTPACPEHLRQLVGLAAVLGFRVAWTPVPHGLEKCSNCESDKKRAERSGADMTKEDYRKLDTYLEFALEYIDRGKVPAARTEIENAKQLLEDMRVKKPRTRE